jgi:hypothetical protein
MNPLKKENISARKFVGYAMTILAVNCGVYLISTGHTALGYLVVTLSFNLNYYTEFEINR